MKKDLTSIKQRNMSKRHNIIATLISVNSIFHCAFLQVCSFFLSLFFVPIQNYPSRTVDCIILEWVDWKRKMHHYAKPFLFVSLFDCISVESRSFTTVGFVSSGWFASYYGFTPMLFRWWRINFEKLNNRHEKWEKLFDEYVKLVWVSGCIVMQLVLSAKPNIKNLFFF